MSEYTWRELERADMDTAAAHAAEMEHRAEQIAREARKIGRTEKPMESIEKLRELAADMNSTEIIDHLDVVGKLMLHPEWIDSWHRAFDAACDEIEREIAERYMELPLDADGVPIHTGDLMESCCADVADRFTAYFFAANGDAMDDETSFFIPKACRHVMPRTLEDVLAEFGRESVGASMGETNEMLAKYAAEIRELLGVEK